MCGAQTDYSAASPREATQENRSAEVLKHVYGFFLNQWDQETSTAVFPFA